MNTIVLDIETYHTRVPQVAARIARDAIAKRPAQNTAVALKNAWDTQDQIQRRADEALAKTAVDVLLAEPLVVCLDDGVEEFVYGIMEPAGEHVALSNLAHRLEASTRDTIWIGHNVEFDLSILTNRWRRHRITPPQWFPTYSNGRFRGRIHDTMRATPCESGLGYIKMSAVCEAYGLPEAKATMWEGEPMTGARVGAAYDAGAYDIIVEYCLADVRVTKALYEIQTLGHVDRYAEVVEQLQALDGEQMPEGARALAKIQVLESLGFMPR